MTDYTQRISNKVNSPFKHPVMISFKTDLIDCFYDIVGKDMKDIGCHFFGHNLIKNHCQEGHRVSSFSTNPDWQEKYWQDYWDCDQLHCSSFPIAKINGIAITSWQVVDPDSDIMEHRKSVCKLNTGFSFAINHDNGLLEDFSFGWEKYDTDQMSYQKLISLSNLVTVFKVKHLKLNKEMLDGYVNP